MNARDFLYASLFASFAGAIVALVLIDSIPIGTLGLAVYLALLSLHLALSGVGGMIVAYLKTRLA